MQHRRSSTSTYCTYGIEKLELPSSCHQAPLPALTRSEARYQNHCSVKMNPQQIFEDDVTEEKGENARLSAFVGAIAVGDLVKSTLGPKGMDKILQSASVPTSTR